MGVHVRSARPRATGGNAVRRTRGATLKRRTNAPDDVVEFLALGLVGPRRHLLPLLHHAGTPRHLRRSSPAEGRVTGVPLSWLRRGTMSVFTLFSLRRKAPAACASGPAEKWRAKCGSICWMRDGLTDLTRPVASELCAAKFEQNLSLRDFDTGRACCFEKCVLEKNPTHHHSSVSHGMRVRNPLLSAPWKDLFRVSVRSTFLVVLKRMGPSHIITSLGVLMKDELRVRGFFQEPAAARVRAGAPRARERSTKPAGTVFAGNVTA